MRPRARREGLEIVEASDETIVYDLERHRVHRLSPTAAQVWRACDGKATTAEIARQLPVEAAAGARTELVTLALARLKKARLLEAAADGGASIQDAPLASRRAALKRLGLAVALLPVITTILGRAT